MGVAYLFDWQGQVPEGVECVGGVTTSRTLKGTFQLTYK